ncbi:hypothetical protein [Streptomyces sp. NRRL F-5126]|uniref:hypothetical protein n=1 Tax=Streptomyces sp. NRRL F-5126 TaxID=1463857 RepID=UPI0004C8B2BB|nr:hypothetical protein [Streptomyces sp. NRRL F-5126]
MRPTALVTVARYLLLDRVTYVVMPWAWGAFGFAIDVVILRLTPAGDTGQRWVGGLAAVFIVVFSAGVQTVARALPFALTLGVSRRTYYLGAGGLALAMAACFGLVVTLGQAVERATGGWGLHMAFFRVPYVLAGPWYMSWLTATTAFALLFVYGMWHGLVHRRAGMTGTTIFGGVQLTALALAAVIATWVHGWTSIVHFFTTITVAGATGVLAILVAIMFAGGFATIRRLTV